LDAQVRQGPLARHAMDRACCSAADFHMRRQRAANQEHDNINRRAEKRWQLIWCHEHCNKPVCDEWRCALAASAKEVGATLKCLKKADNFVNWAVTSGHHTHYVLVTDWREVKQSISSVTKCRPEHRPRLTIVLCKSSCQSARASEWAESVADSCGPVHVCWDTASPKELIGEMLSMLGCGNAPQPQTAHVPTPLRQRPAAPPTDAGVTGPRTKVAQWVQEVAGLPWPVADPIIQTWVSCGCPAEVERLLQKAAPDFYDD